MTYDLSNNRINSLYFSDPYASSVFGADSSYLFADRDSLYSPHVAAAGRESLYSPPHGGSRSLVDRDTLYSPQGFVCPDDSRQFFSLSSDCLFFILRCYHHLSLSLSHSLSLSCFLSFSLFLSL